MMNNDSYEALTYISNLFKNKKWINHSEQKHM